MDLGEYSKKELEQMAHRVRRSVVHMAYAAGAAGAHLGGNLSCVEILTVLYGKYLVWNRQDPYDPRRDRFLAGKAHCILTQYSVMREMGRITETEQYSFLENGGLLMGYPKRPEFGLEYAGGTLGMALSVAVGMALDAKQRQRSNKVYVLLGDGECDEGMVWEAVMSAAKYQLGNLVVIVDRNHLQLSGTVEEVMALGDLGEKFQAFGWHVQEADGHQIHALTEALDRLDDSRPNVLIAHTIKGKGISFVEHQAEWHQNVLTEPLYQKALAELEGKI